MEQGGGMPPSPQAVMVTCELSGRMWGVGSRRQRAVQRPGYSRRLLGPHDSREASTVTSQEEDAVFLSGTLGPPA